MTMLVNIDKLPVGARWQGPHGGDRHVKLSPLSHRNERTGELILDERLFGRSSVEPMYVEEVRA